MGEKAECDSGAGCLFFFGIIITACCIGTLTQEVYGWLTVGILLVIWGLGTAGRK